MIPPCLTLSNIRYVSRVKWSNPGKGVAPSPTPRCSSNQKGCLLIALDYGRQLLLLSYRKMKPLPIRGLPDWVARWIRICLYFSSFIIPLILTKSFTPFAVKYPLNHYINSSMFNYRLQVHIFHLLSNPSSYILFSLWTENFNFDSSLHNTFFHCSTVHFFDMFKSFLSVFLSYIRFPSFHSTMKAFFHRCTSHGWTANLGARCLSKIWPSFLTRFNSIS